MLTPISHPEQPKSLGYGQYGASLIELMIAMALGIAALAAVASVVGFGIGVNGKLLANSRLNEEINSIGDLLTRDVKRAGFNADTIAMVTSPVDFPSAFSNSVVVSQNLAEANQSCLLYAYDQNANGVLELNENFGFRLRSLAVEIRGAGAGCSDIGWEPLTDTDIVTITDLRFTSNQVIYNNVISTQVTIFLQGELAANNNLSRQFSTSFLVRNYD